MSENTLLFLMVGVAAGAAAALLVVTLRRRRENRIAQQVISDAHRDRSAEFSEILDQLKTTFSALSREALSANSDDFLKLAKTKMEEQTVLGAQTLETKKKLIDARLEELGQKLGALNTAIQGVEKQRAEAQGSLRSQLERTTQATNRLQETTGQLQEALANPKRRGQWGERIAEDVLRLAGFVEGVSYLKQKKLAEGGIPDFTFMLPGNQRIHMDVKFPLNNYLKALDTSDESTRSTHVGQFLRDVRSRIKEITTRAYINPAEGTVDFVLVFIPNEQIYGFIHEHDGSLLDDALRQKVILCSPLTLYAILAVIRQSVSNFRLEQVSSEILSLLTEFRKHWEKYVECMDRMGERLRSANVEYDKIVGVRTRQLDRQLDKIDNLQASQQKQLLDGEATSQQTMLTDTERSHQT